MTLITYDVRKLDESERVAMERIVGQRLADHQMLVIQVVDDDGAAPPSTTSPDGLPAWCDIYQGLDDSQIEEIEKSITRSPLSRELV